MGQPVVHFEIGCRDKQKTQAFFAELFGWTVSEAGPASMIDTQAAGQGIQGHFTALGHEPHQYTIFYVQVDDIASSLAKAESLGGNDPGSTGHHPHWHICLVRGPRGKYDRAMDPGRLKRLDPRGDCHASTSKQPVTGRSADTDQFLPIACTASLPPRLLFSPVHVLCFAILLHLQQNSS